MKYFKLLDKESIQNLQPAYFALVMATSIVAIACGLQGLAGVADILAGISIAVFVVLAFLTFVRLFLFHREVLADLMNHARALGFLTIAAGSALLGCELILIRNWYTVAFVLWLASIMSWIFLTYAIFTIFTVKENKPALDQGINGGWLLAVVSTQAVAQLTLLLIPAFPNSADLCCLSVWHSGYGVGCCTFG